MARALLGIWTWLAFAIVSILGFIVSIVIFVVTVPFDRNRVAIGTAIRVTGMCMVKSVPAWRFSYEGPRGFKPPGKSVCVSNHVSNLDPFLLAHAPWEMKFLAKSTLFKIPVVGWGIGLAGDIPLVRGSPASVKRAMSRAAFYVKNGMPILIFPEGTRSETGTMLPFKDGAFRLAIEQQAAVVPLAVFGTTKALRKGDWKPGVAKGVFTAGEPIETVGMSLKDVATLREMTRSRVEELSRDLERRFGAGKEVA